MSLETKAQAAEVAIEDEKFGTVSIYNAERTGVGKRIIRMIKLKPEDGTFAPGGWSNGGKSSIILGSSIMLKIARSRSNSARTTNLENIQL